MVGSAGAVARSFFVWIIAGLIMMLADLLVISMAGGFEGLSTTLLVHLALQKSPFPINFMATRTFDPIFLVAQSIIFVTLIFLIEARKKTGEHPLTY